MAAAVPACLVHRRRSGSPPSTLIALRDPDPTIMAETTSTFDCDLCGSSEATNVPHATEYTKDNASISICQNCGLVYTRERRSAQAIADSWSDAIYGDGYTARIPAVRARQQYVADTIDVELGLAGKTVCDIGGGEGQFLEIARNEYGALVFTSEASAKNCFHLELAGIPYFQGTIEEFSESEVAQDRKFDIATMMWTLECCQNPRAMLEAAWKVIKPGGHVVIATGSRVLVPFKKPLHMFFSDSRERDTHPLDFSANTLSGFLNTAGFEKVFVNRYLDSDVLLVIGQRVEQPIKPDYPLDDPAEVAAFFERWHQESQHYHEV